MTPSDWNPIQMSRPPLRSEVETLELANKLKAVEKLAEGLSSTQDLGYLRLEDGLDRLPPLLREATRRTLLQVRRAARRWDVLSVLGAEEAPRISTPLRSVAQSLRQGDLPERLEHLEQLVREEAFEAAPVLATRLIVESEPVMAAALARAVGYLGGEATLVVLKKSIRHESRDVRLGAIEGLRHQLGEESIRLLVERLGDQEAQIRKAAIDALRSRSPEAILSLLAAFPQGRGNRIIQGAIPLLRTWASLPGVRDFARSRGLVLEEERGSVPPPGLRLISPSS
jgi:hypothetical protein